jgi:hypothetical protein
LELQLLGSFAPAPVFLQKSGWRHAGRFSEQAAEMPAVGETERSRDLSEPLPSQHQLLRPSYALVHDVSMRRRPISVGKHPEELPWAEANYASKIEKIQFAIEIRVNVILHQGGMGGGKSPWP